MRLSTQLKHLKEQILHEISSTRESGIAPDGVNVVPYIVTRNGTQYEYFKAVALEPIFEGRNGEKTKTQHLGHFHSSRCRKMCIQIEHRNRIKHLEKMLRQIEEWEKTLPYYRLK